MGDRCCTRAGSSPRRLGVRFLVDANLSPVVAAHLRQNGHDTVHVADIGLFTANDETILGAAADDKRVVISSDADFAALLALGGLSKPSLILLRSADHLTPTEQAELILANLPAIGDDLEDGAIVTTARGRLRIRQLPIEP
jgi:predicted nuclease of predicted toxin-antitoxin system